MSSCMHEFSSTCVCVCVPVGIHSCSLCIYSTYWVCVCVCYMCEQKCPWGNMVPTVCSAGGGEAVGVTEMLFDLWVCFPGGNTARVVIADIKHLPRHLARDEGFHQVFYRKDEQIYLLCLKKRLWRISVVPAEKHSLSFCSVVERLWWD